MYNIFSKIKRFLKKYWIEGILLVCLLSSFSNPVLNVIVLSVSILILIIRLINKKRLKKD
jgi:hypothetical protein